MAELSAKKRDRLKTGSFALPRERAYPIHDISHARNALARAAQHASPVEQAKIRAAVCKKYPSLKK
jgi:hypothetical protein